MAPWQLQWPRRVGSDQICGWRICQPGRLEVAEATEFWRPPHKVATAACFLDIAASESRRCWESPPGVFIDYLAPSTPRHPRASPVRAATSTVNLFSR
ncbi:hypothetical protein OsI_06795 [Oryza sativa Indica Group]|uniref:Uncharacterized protein n=1 Tax=Oryza sativa subsp. indica TaxID=39946 RepID=A2X3K5_ORYSI|nr:hypothetical protein OsI_06795 [Oryza sativa Indica Group]